MTARQTVLRGLTAERDDLAEDAARLAAYIKSDAFRRLPLPDAVTKTRLWEHRVWQVDRLNRHIAWLFPEVAQA